jgi:hypothetical protein
MRRSYPAARCALVRCHDATARRTASPASRRARPGPVAINRVRAGSGLSYGSWAI